MNGYFYGVPPVGAAAGRLAEFRSVFRGEFDESVTAVKIQLFADICPVTFDRAHADE